MIEVDYFCKVTCPFTKEQVDTITKLAARAEKKIRGTVEVTIVGDKEIQKLNKQYRGLNKVTDVLSFAWEEDPIVPSSMLGQIYISYPQIKRQAGDFAVTPKNEFVRMLVHGLLHIVGYDHLVKREADVMFALQEKIVATAAKKLEL